MTRRRKIAFASLSVALLSCSPTTSARHASRDGGSSLGDSADAGPAPKPAFTYFHDIKPLMEANCVKCHQSGSIGPMQLTTYDQVAAYADPIKLFVGNRTMPPWPPSRSCGPSYEGDRSLTDQQIAMVGKWVDDGAPEGDPSDVGPAQTDPDAASILSRVDLTLEMPVAYAPQVHPDEYRCFLIPWPLATKKYVTAYRFTPGDPSVTHHITTVVAGPAEVFQYQALDAADPGPGWSCFGNAGGTAHGQIGLWVPGMHGVSYPPGVGVEMQPGSAVIVQVHYNSREGQTYAPTKASIDLQLEDHVDHIAWYMPFVDPTWTFPYGMHIAPGDSHAMYSYTIDPTFSTSGKAFNIYTAFLHMHTLGTSTSLSIERADGSSECLLDIDHWSFHWQGEYRLTQPPLFKPGDKLKLECHWDNSANNQPIVNGQPQEPKDVYWGWGTGSEMCIASVLVSTP